MSTPQDQYVAFQRFGFGARPGDRSAIASDPRGAVLAEIADRDAALLPKGNLPSASEGLIGHYKSNALRKEFRKEATEKLRVANAAKANMPDDADMAGGNDMAMGGAGNDMSGNSMSANDMGGNDMSANAMGGDGKAKPQLIKPKLPDDPAFRYGREVYFSEVDARLARLRTLRIGYAERLVAFWANHFTVEADKGQRIRTIVGAYEREAIRPYVLGRFRDMLGAVVKHPAMLVYLDNFRSVGPNSIYGLAKGEGLNENMAREAMELHTLGVDGGYTQADVIAFAKILSGWTMMSPKDPETPGAFIFSAPRHEPGVQTLLGKAYPAEGVTQGEKALDDLARHPSTARHIARRLATAFVADKPAQDLVDRLAKVFLDTDGDLGAVSRALASDDAAWAAPTSKFRLPSEYVAAGARALNVELPGRYVHRILRGFGEEPWNATSPQGFPIASADWVAPDALTNRLDFAEILADRADPQTDARALLSDIIGDVASDDTRETIARAESPQQAVALLLMSPEFQRR